MAGQLQATTDGRTGVLRHWRVLVVTAVLVVAGMLAGRALYHKYAGCDPQAYFGTCLEDKGNPTILDASPLEGEPEGGNAIEINGSHFGPGVRVWFGDKEATTIKIINNIRIKAVVPGVDHPQLVDIKVARGDGPKAVLKGGYRYEEDNEVHAVTPAVGPTSGGTVVTIRGEGFAPETRVSFGGEKFQVPKYINQTTLQATTPPHEPGLVVLNVRTGEDELTVDAGFTYQ